VAKVTEELEGAWHFNTSTAQVMELLNAVRSWLEEGHPTDDAERAVLRETLELMVSVLSPFVPHLAEELWERLGHEPGIFTQPWPEADADALAADEVELGVQVDGKLRARLSVSTEAGDDVIREAALSEERVAAHLEGREVVRVIVVPGRLVNIVSRPR
jgi:leucyl-tRNA synthetase